jgi:hypothetical protein
MDSTREIGGVVGAIVWIMISDVVGGTAGLVAGWRIMACVEPMLGALAASVLLVSVPAGLCAGGLLGVTSLGWIADLTFAESRPALSNSCL